MPKLPMPTGIKTKSTTPEAGPDTQALQSFINASKDAQINVSSSPAIPAANAMPAVAMSKNQTKTFPLVLSAEAHQEIVAAARKDGKSLKEFIMTAVYEKMARNA